MIDGRARSPGSMTISGSTTSDASAAIVRSHSRFSTTVSYYSIETIDTYVSISDRPGRRKPASSSAMALLQGTPWSAGLLLSIASATSQQPTSEEAFLRGLKEYSHGALDDARMSFEACLKHDPARTDCMTNLGSVLVDIGGVDDHALAEKLYRTVLEIDPAHSDAAFNLALQLQDRKTDQAALREAAALYVEVVAADSTRWDAWANLGSALAALNDRPLQATRAFQRGIVELERSHELMSGEPSEDEVRCQGGPAIVRLLAIALAFRMQSSTYESRPQLAYLADMYYKYGTHLAMLSDEQCASYAADSTSLLVGIDSHDGSQKSTSDVGNSICIENAQNI